LADLRGQVVLITGSSRGLGFLLAREFARQGCRLIICARDQAEVGRAQADLARQGAEVAAFTCDITRSDEVQRLIDEATRRFGRIDILVNNAGVIQTGPWSTMTLADYEEAFNLMFWGMLYPTQAVLPQMLQRRYGRIVNITSIGGKVSVPHLLPYSSAKFAAVGFSQGLRAELAGQGIIVTTIVPGLMRTGSYLNAFFKGRQEDEFTWFSLGSSLPFISMDAERAARQIVAAAKRGEAERTLSLPALLLARFHGLFPGPTADIAGLVNRFLLPSLDGQPPLVAPSANMPGAARARGMIVQTRLNPPRNRLLHTLTTLGRQAAERFHQYPGPVAMLAQEQGEPVIKKRLVRVYTVEET
jgi:NAD(P)-dependent dehydrogenase (short-subunit alcohol dehydrogenase family)